jgi:putative hydrolase of HD superfamily
MMINMKANGGTWREHGVTADRVLAKVVLIDDGSPELGTYARELVRHAVAEGLLSPGPQGEGSVSAGSPEASPTGG